MVIERSKIGISLILWTKPSTHSSIQLSKEVWDESNLRVVTDSCQQTYIFNLELIV